MKHNLIFICWRAALRNVGHVVPCQNSKMLRQTWSVSITNVRFFSTVLSVLPLASGWGPRPACQCQRKKPACKSLGRNAIPNRPTAWVDLRLHSFPRTCRWSMVINARSWTKSSEVRMRDHSLKLPAKRDKDGSEVLQEPSRSPQTHHVSSQGVFTGTLRNLIRYLHRKLPDICTKTL